MIEQDQFGNGVIVGGIVGAVLAFFLSRAGVIGLIVAAGLLGLVALILRELFAIADESPF